MRGGDRAAQMHPDDRIPVFWRHRHQHAVTQNPGVIHQDIQASKRVERSVHQSLCPFPVRDIIGVDDGLASHRQDLPHHLLCGRFVGTNARRRATKVIDDDFGPLTRQLQRVRTP